MADRPTCLACAGDALGHWASARDVEYLSVPDSYTYHKCAACGALSIFPVPTNRLAEIYPPAYYSFNANSDAPSLVTRAKLALDRRLFKSVFRRLDEKSAYSALDIGGGTGWVLDEARRSEPRLRRTVVVDIDAGARGAALNAGHDYFLGRIEDYCSTEKFDLVLMLNLIEHVQDPVGTLIASRGLLAEGGLILVKTPNHDALDARLFRHRNWGGYHCPRHWVLFTPESFAQAATTAGLDIVKLSFTQGAPFWAVSAVNWMKERGWTTVTREQPVVVNPLLSLCMMVFAAIDFIRMPFMRTSQMIVLLGKA